MDTHVSQLLHNLPAKVLVEIIAALEHRSGVEIKYGRDATKSSTEVGEPMIFASSQTEGTYDLASIGNDLPAPSVFRVTCIARVEQQLTFTVKAHTPEEAIEFASRRHGADGRMICEDECEHLETIEETNWEAEL